MKRHHVHVPGRRTRRSGALLAVAVLGAAGALLLGASRPAAAGTATTSCPTTNPPNELVLGGGSPQTAKLDAPFSTPLQVTLDNSNGCPVTTSLAGTPVTFTAPTSAATGAFSSSGSNTVTVGADGQGNASASFGANDVAGTYTVVASSAYGTVDFTLTNTASSIAATITPQAPVDRAAAIGAAYAAPLQVTVLDANGNPVEGAGVSFSLGSSGGGGGSGAGSSSQTAGATFDDGSSTATETTNAAGVATSPKFTANGTAGPFSAIVSTAGITEPATFKLYNLPGEAPGARLIGSSKRSAIAGDRFAKPLAVVVRSASGQPLEGLTVTFTLGSSGGGGGAGSASAGASFIGGSSQATATTGPRGRATSPLFTADSTAGMFEAFAIVPGVAAPIEISLDNLAAAPPKVVLVGGDARSATVEGRYRRPLEVKVLGDGGAPDQGVSVTFALGSSGGGSGGAGGSGSAGASFLGGSAQATATTGADGIATSPLFSANGTPGSFTATAAVAGVTNPASFSLDNLAGKAPSIRPRTAGDAASTVGGRYAQPLEVTVRGGDGEALQGASVTFTLGSAGGGGGGTSGGASAGASFVGGSSSSTVTTDAGGVAVSPAFVANTVAGSFEATAALAGSIRVASFALKNLAGKPDSVTAGAAASEETTVGSAFPIRLAVTVEDTHANPVKGAAVTFRAPAVGASGRFDHMRTVRVRTNANGIAVAPALVANGTAGGYAVTATVAGVAPAAFALVNDPAGQNG